MINERLNDEELVSLFKAMKSHFEVMAESGSEAEVIECCQIVRALRELQECRNTEKASEPVVFTDEQNLHHIAMGRETSLIWGKQNSEVGDIALYRKAQPAPVVPDEISLEKVSELTAARGTEYSIRDSIIAAKWWNACRAAMLSAAPQEVK